MEKDFLGFVASVMGIKIDEISMDTRYKEYEKWDSLMMLTLIMEIEAEYNVSIPIESANRIATMADLFDLVKQQNS